MKRKDIVKNIIINSKWFETDYPRERMNVSEEEYTMQKALGSLPSYKDCIFTWKGITTRGQLVTYKGTIKCEQPDEDLTNVKILGMITNPDTYELTYD